MNPINCFTVQEAIRLIKEGNILFYTEGLLRVFIKEKTDQVYIKSQNLSYILSVQDFKQLFSKTKFYLFTSENEETIDLLRDQEYYTWKYK